MKLFFVTLCFSSLSYAGGEKILLPDYMQQHKPYISITCIDAQTQNEMDECGKKSLKNSIEKMNETLTLLKNNYRANEADLLSALEKSQVSWESYKNSSCKLETFYSRTGTGFGSIYDACLEMKINERISYLNWLADNP